MCRVPADMNHPSLADKMGAEAVISIRDMLVLVGAPDQALRDFDERQEILDREPWRRDGVRWVVYAKSLDGFEFGCFDGEIDWSGTRFAKRGT